MDQLKELAGSTSDSTKEITRLLSRPTSIIEATLSSESAQLLDPVVDNIGGDYEMVNGFSYNADAYFPSELNQIIFDICNKNSTFSMTLSDPKFSLIVLHIFESSSQKIVLFNAVKDLPEGRDNLPLLDTALEYYREVQTLGPEDILLIPVAEIVRRHFKLLTLTHQSIK